MDTLEQLLRWIHIGLGFLGLVAFWFPIFSRKGGTLHRQAGNVFRFSAFAVLGAAGISLLLDYGRLISSQMGPAARPETWSFLLFLSYLTVVTAIILSHGFAVLRHKRDVKALATSWRIVQAWLALLSSVFIIGWAWYWQPKNAALLYALSPIGLLNGISMLRLYRAKTLGPKVWIQEHLGALIGCGIAYHTAFSAFGARQLFDYSLNGWLAVVPWILPTLLGIPAIMFWNRRYNQPAIARTPSLG